GCGMGDILVDDVRNKLELIPTVAEADVELVFDPPWNRTIDVRSRPAGNRNALGPRWGRNRSVTSVRLRSLTKVTNL
ncbi:MAG: sufT, partial [Xanthomonadaceae bacterium]|nr:sufT [Xanthomonadaceae bacterium]